MKVIWAFSQSSFEISFIGQNLSFFLMGFFLGCFCILVVLQVMMSVGQYIQDLMAL